MDYGQCIHSQRKIAQHTSIRMGGKGSSTGSKWNVAVLLPRVLQLLRLEHIEVFADVATRVGWLNDVVHEPTLRSDLRTSKPGHKKSIKTSDSPIDWRVTSAYAPLG